MNELVCDSLKKAQKKWQEHWDKIVLEYPDETVIRFIMDESTRKAGSGQNRILDFGCGTGRHALLMAKNGYQVTAMDYVQSCLDKLKLWADKEQLSIEILQNEALKLPAGDKSFDIIVAWGSVFLSRKEQVIDLLKELNRVLELSGKIIIECRSQEDDAYQNKDRYIKEGVITEVAPDCYIDVHDILRYYPSCEEIADILEAAGFDTVKMEKLEFTTDNRKKKNSWWHIYGEKVRNV